MLSAIRLVKFSGWWQSNCGNHHPDSQVNTLSPSESPNNNAVTIMATATVTGHGRRPSMRQPELQMPTIHSASQSTSSPIDKFPPYEDSLDAAVGSAAPTTRPHRSPSVKYALGDQWEPRKNASWSRDHPLGVIRSSKHRPRKSISEAISIIRTRNGSVSANAHELAEALKAPVSYRLVVRVLPTVAFTRRSGSVFC